MPCLGSNDRDGEACSCIPACLGRWRRHQRPEASSTRGAPREVANTSMIQMTATETVHSESGRQTPSRDVPVLQAVAPTTSRTISHHQAFPSESTERQAVLLAAATREGSLTHRSQTGSTGGQARVNLRVPSPAGSLPSGPAVETAIRRVSPASVVAERPVRPSLACLGLEGVNLRFASR